MTSQIYILNFPKKLYISNVEDIREYLETYYFRGRTLTFREEDSFGAGALTEDSSKVVTVLAFTTPKSTLTIRTYTEQDSEVITSMEIYEASNT